MLKRWREKDQTSYAHKRQKNIKRKNGEKRKESYVVTQLKRLDYYPFFEFFDLKRKRTDFSHAKKRSFFLSLFFSFLFVHPSNKSTVGTV